MYMYTTYYRFVLTSISSYNSDTVEVCGLSVQVINNNNLSWSITQGVDWELSAGGINGITDSTQGARVFIRGKDLWRNNA